MTYQGTVKNGVVVLETGAKPPEGARVRVEVTTSAPQQESLSEMLLRHAGCMTGPPDLAAEHDHYAHGAPKRSASP